ncbi:uncharacterized protein LOC124276853 [Haliotis rubra]|uniref:uncharacterized protein LOC124276853 n=1 Tax=Haliotis rubra TaxID=36100 RepID=UPI001EE5F519|nr:uncharacterized protein LOC124276853 [Haliotis rubra]
MSKVMTVDKTYLRWLPLLCLLIPPAKAAAVSVSIDGGEVTVLAVMLMSVAVTAGLVVLLLMCTDCYNSEVDSRSHPACGGHHTVGGNYPTSTSQVNEAVLQSSIRNNGYHTGTSDNSPLPYSLSPSNVPTSSGFRGYQSDTVPSSAAPLLNSSTGPAGGGGQAIGGTHFNPLEPEEPPPSYGEAVRYH